MIFRPTWPQLVVAALLLTVVHRPASATESQTAAPPALGVQGSTPVPPTIPGGYWPRPAVPAWPGNGFGVHYPHAPHAAVWTHPAWGWGGSWGYPGYSGFGGYRGGMAAGSGFGFGCGGNQLPTVWWEFPSPRRMALGYPPAWRPGAIRQSCCSHCSVCRLHGGPGHPPGQYCCHHCAGCAQSAPPHAWPHPPLPPPPGAQFVPPPGPPAPQQLLPAPTPPTSEPATNVPSTSDLPDDESAFP